MSDSNSWVKADIFDVGTPSALNPEINKDKYPGHWFKRNGRPVSPNDLWTPDTIAIPRLLGGSMLDAYNNATLGTTPAILDFLNKVENIGIVIADYKAKKDDQRSYYWDETTDYTLATCRLAAKR